MKNLFLMLLIFPAVAGAQGYCEALPDIGYFSIYHADLERMEEVEKEISPALASHFDHVLSVNDFKQFSWLVEDCSPFSRNITFISTISRSQFRYFVSESNKVMIRPSAEGRALNSFPFKKDEVVHIGLFEDDFDKIVMFQIKNGFGGWKNYLGEELCEELKTGEIIEHNSNSSKAYLVLWEHQFIMAAVDKELLLVLATIGDMESGSFFGTEIQKLISDSVSQKAYWWTFTNDKLRRESHISSLVMSNSPGEAVEAIEQSLKSFECYSISSEFFKDGSISRIGVDIYPDPKAAREQYQQKKNNPGKKVALKIAPDGQKIVAPQNKGDREELEDNRIIKYRTRTLEDIEAEQKMLKTLKKKS